jgi:Shedu protein SduA, C-terminal
MKTLKYCKIRNKGYGQRWQDFKIHYVGERPKLIRDDGAFSSGKSLLEALAMKFRNFELILTPEESRIQGKVSAPQVCVALPELQKMNAGLFTQKKYVTQQAVSHLLSSLFPKDFAECQAPPSATAPLSATAPPPTVIRKKPVPRKLKGRFNLKALRRLAREMKKRIETHKSEGTWRNLLRENILSIQRGYIELIPKADLELSSASYPGFFLVTSDGYLDIPEIKTPFTELLSYDEDSQTHVWSVEIAGAVARVENYLQSVSKLGDELRKKVKDCCGIELPVIKPRGIIFAGNSAQFKGNRPAREDFELLNAASQNVNVVTYDELLTRLRNHVAALSRSKEKKE